MSFSSLLPATLACSLFLLSGCGDSMQSSWQATKTFYGEYVNPPASINYEDKGSLDEAEIKLASHMVGIDIQLEQLERYLQNSDRPPTGESVALLFQRFPWISGLAAIDVDGKVLAQEPLVSLKPLEFGKMLEQHPRNEEIRGVRGMVQETPLGPEVLAGVPVFHNADIVGLMVTHFDIRSLLAYATGTEDLVVLAPQGILWPGRFVTEETPLAGRDWASITKSAINGTVSNDTGTFIWIVRFIGSQPIIFAAPVKGTFPEDPNQLSALSQTSSFAAPRITPVTESQVIEGTDKINLLLTPLPPVREPNLREQTISD